MLKNFFGQSADAGKNADMVFRLLEAYLDCPCERIAAGTSYDKVTEALNTAVVQGQTQGYVPVLVVADALGNLTEMLYDNAGLSVNIREWLSYKGECQATPSDFALGQEDKNKLRAYRGALIAAWKEDGADRFLQERIEECLDGDEEFDLEAYWGGDEITAEDILDGVSVPFDYHNGLSYDLLLARIPAAEPWQAAAWLPMGNWNECPGPEDLLAMARRWYDKYGAVICCVSSDEMEFRVSNPPTEEAQAYSLAKEQYYFCQDRVEQYADPYNLKTLANSLTKSPYWYFWWD